MAKLLFNAVEMNSKSTRFSQYSRISFMKLLSHCNAIFSSSLTNYPHKYRLHRDKMNSASFISDLQDSVETGCLISEPQVLSLVILVLKLEVYRAVQLATWTTRVSIAGKLDICTAGGLVLASLLPDPEVCRDVCTARYLNCRWFSFGQLSTWPRSLYGRLYSLITELQEC